MHSREIYTGWNRQIAHAILTEWDARGELGQEFRQQVQSWLRRLQELSISFFAHI